MKASKIIAELQEIILKHGDLEVTKPVYEYDGYCGHEEVEEVNVRFDIFNPEKGGGIEII